MNPNLPNARIEVLGPPPTSGTRDTFVELAMEGGCKTFSWVKAMKKKDKNGYKASCHTVREDGAFIEAGEIKLDEQDIYHAKMDVVPLRAQVGILFQKPNPFPKSIYDNIAYGPSIHGLVADKAATDEVVECSLQRAGLWNEVKDRPEEPGTGLSGGQQQRLCIARTIAVSPEVILMDEPCSALDPIATAKIEELIDGHIVKRYNDELEELNQMAIEMARMVRGQIADAVDTLEKEDVEAAHGVVERDKTIDSLEIETDDKILHLIGKRQPAAKDLRELLAVGKIVSDLERVGDQARRLARLTILLYAGDNNPPDYRLIADTPKLAKLVDSMVEKSIRSFETLSPELALEVVRMEGELDEEMKSALRRGGYALG